MQNLGITGVVLAGGQGRRMGQQDKGLLQLKDRPLIAHILDAFNPQCDAVLINANQNHQRYAQLGHKVVTDTHFGFQGPLAGMACALAASKAPWLVTVPCDGPVVATDYVARMLAAVQEANVSLAVARDTERLQPVYALLSASLLPSLQAFLESGERKIDRWYQQHQRQEVDFSDWPQMFENFNTPEQLEEYKNRNV